MIQIKVFSGYIANQRWRHEIILAGVVLNFVQTQSCDSEARKLEYLEPSLLQAYPPQSGGEVLAALHFLFSRKIDGEFLELLLESIDGLPSVFRRGCSVSHKKTAQRRWLVRGAHGIGQGLLFSNLFGEPSAEAGNQVDSEIDASARPHRAAAVLERMSRAEWGLGRSAESQARLTSALALLPEDDRSPERASLLAWQAKLYMLQSRFAEAVDIARGSLELIRATGDSSSLSRVLNALGVALAAGGDLEGGVAVLREALDLGRRGDYVNDHEAAVTNLSEVLHFAGRTGEGLALARTGRAELMGVGRACEWLDMLIAEELFAAGEWDAAEAALPSPDQRYVGTTRAYHDLVRAEIALGRGDHDEVAARLADVLGIDSATAEPQLGGVVQAQRAELARRGGDLDAARNAIDIALGAIRVTGDQDPMRLALVGEVGVAVEADAAERARDLGEREAEAFALERADALLERVRRGVALMGPLATVEPARLAGAEADATRAAGRSDPARWAAAAALWDEIGRPYPAALARWREAEALAGIGDRDGASTAAGHARAAARALGARWLESEVEGLAARARLRLDGDAPAGAAEAPGAGTAEPDGADADPFGLTPRERQVLAMLAGGATNREIGAALYMAEKTASVHVSRILAKLDVRSRTEAAAVAHRHGLAA